MKFTDSLYEYMMRQKPEPGRVQGDSAPVYPPGHKCHGCPYGRDRPCIVICMKRIQEKRDKKKGV